MLLGESPDREFYVAARLDRSGTIDESFADQGFFRISKRENYSGDGAKMCLNEVGDLTVLYGNPVERHSFAVVLQRSLADGSLDESFGSNGEVVTPLTSGYGYAEQRHLVCQEDGSYLVAGIVPIIPHRSPFRTRIARYDGDGGVATGFGDDGQLTLDVGDRQDIPVSIDVDPSGRFLIATRSDNASEDFAVTRLNPDGSLDTSFGTGGTWQLDLHSYDDFPIATRATPNGDILVGGHTSTGEETRIAIIRLKGDRTGPPPWQNQSIATDVNDDRQTTTIDALRVINELNLNGAHKLLPYRNVAIYWDYMDVNGDGYIAPSDAMAIINVLNDLSTGEGESAAAPWAFVPFLHPTAAPSNPTTSPMNVLPAGRLLETENIDSAMPNVAIPSSSSQRANLVDLVLADSFLLKNSTTLGAQLFADGLLL